jgi:hypothetical protein
MPTTQPKSDIAYEETFLAKMSESAPHLGTSFKGTTKRPLVRNKTMSTQEITTTEEKKRDRVVRIHIDRHPYESPNPTTGAALYALGKVPADLQLYREVEGDKEDEPIDKDNEKEHLMLDEHFYSKKERHKGFDIIVNAEQHHLDKKRVSFDQIAKLGFPTPPTGPNILFTVTYYNGPKANPEGVLTAGQTVKVKNGMVFNVKATDRS